ncbi:TetR/AcrR family transcriptional regulator [Novosphingobium sp. BL-52-GroH]|uniref:TetR/AcrR family transcriptional regulator n=1 Tax=Novosphingobium sp. BL-52-GroH TaxID=3349877 RepID=UPI00384D85AB
MPPPSTSPDTPPKKSARRNTPRLSQDRRVADIILAARAVIREKGYEQASMAEIAERAGVVEGTLYRYFENRRALLIRVADEWFSEKLAEDTGIAGIRDTRDKLRHIIWRALQITRSEPALSRFVLTEVRPTVDYRESRFYALIRRFTSEVRTLCREAVATGEFRADVPDTLMRDLVFGGMEHQTWAFLRGDGDFDTASAADGIADVVYRGMSVRPATQDALDAAIERIEAEADRLAGLPSAR